MTLPAVFQTAFGCTLALSGLYLTCFLRFYPQRRIFRALFSFFKGSVSKKDGQEGISSFSASAAALAGTLGTAILQWCRALADHLLCKLRSHFLAQLFEIVVIPPDCKSARFVRAEPALLHFCNITAAGRTVTDDFSSFLPRRK